MRQHYAYTSNTCIENDYVTIVSEGNDGDGNNSALLISGIIAFLAVIGSVFHSRSKKKTAMLLQYHQSQHQPLVLRLSPHNHMLS